MLDSTVPRAPATRIARPLANGGNVEERSRIRVLIVDDHSVVRMGLRVFFDLQDDIEVVGEAADGSEGVALARRLEPDVVLMDLLMPNMDGITAIGRIKAERPETEIVTMTSFIEEEKVTAALIARLRAVAPDTRVLVLNWSETADLSSGADAYARKTFRPHELIDAVVATIRRSHA